MPCQHDFGDVEDEDEGYYQCVHQWARKEYRNMNCSKGKQGGNFFPLNWREHDRFFDILLQCAAYHSHSSTRKAWSHLYRLA